MPRSNWRPDDLVVPIIFVPYGDPPPRDWRAKHPGAIRMLKFSAKK